MSVVISEPIAGSDKKSLCLAWLGAWEASADAAYCRDLQGRLLAANVAFARKFGRSTTAMHETLMSDFVHSEDVASLHATTAELNRPPHRAVAEHRWLTPQGVRWFGWEETALLDDAGAIVAIRAIGRDITRQRLAEEQFYRLSRAVEQSPVSIVITDPDGRAQYVNSKYTEVSGHTLEDILDREIEVLRNGHPDAASFDSLWATVRAGGEWRGELPTTRPDGSTVWESVKVSCLRSPNGEITNYLCLREDVSERKKLEHELRQAQKMESLGTLAGGIAHDFNNLLAIINGYAEFCQMGPQEPAVLQKSLREIHRAAMRASGLVRQILTFSRKHEVHFAPFDLNQLARDLVHLLSETFPRTVSIQLELFDRLPPLLADQNQMQQIVLNLCVNARDAMPTGGMITLSTRTIAGASLRKLGADPARNYAWLTVTDTGCGMSPEVRQRIFEPFFTTKGVNHGTGLGLAVVYGIVVAHQGFIDVESKVGVGSSFHVYLPLAPATAVIADVATNSEFPGGTESLLIVDDEESLRSLLAASLSQKGYHALTAASGIEAIELISDPTRPLDAVLLDLNMPGATGFDVMKIIRLCRPNLPVIVISGHLTSAVRTEFERLGQSQFVEKPYKLDELGRNLRQLLDRK